MKCLKNNMIYIGIIIMSLTLLYEHIFNEETNITGFIKGFACGFEIVGVFIIARNNNKKK